MNDLEKLLSKDQTSIKTFNILPHAIWDSSKKIDFYLTTNPETSSFYNPNKLFLDKFPNSQRLM